MRMAFISLMSGAPWGGSEELWTAAAKRALLLGHQVLVSVLDWGDLPKKTRELKGLGAEISLRKRKDIKDISESICRRVIKKIRYKMKIDIENPFSHIKKFDPDTVLINQGGTYEICQRYHLKEIIESLNVSFSILCHSISESDVPNEKMRLDALSWFEKAKFIGFVTKKSLELAERQLAGKIPNAVILKNPVNLDDKKIVPFNKNLKKVKFACVGSLTVAWKGYDLLIKILSNEKWKRRNWELSIYGRGKDKKYLEELISFYDLKNKVLLKGHINKIKNIWKENQIHLMPSRIESAPLALVEAMICGRPSVVTNVGGISEWVREGKNGYLAECPSIESFDATLERAWIDKKNWEELGKEAHNFALNQIDENPGKTLLSHMINHESG